MDRNNAILQAAQSPQQSVPPQTPQAMLGALIKQINPILSFLDSISNRPQGYSDEFIRAANEMEMRNMETVRQESERRRGNPIIRQIAPPPGSESSRIRTVPASKPQIML
jgi:hypothetical protein